MPSKKKDEEYIPDDDFEDEIEEKKYRIKLLKDSIMEQDLKKQLLEKKMIVKELERKMRSKDKYLPRLPRVKKYIIKKEKEETIYNPITNKRIKKNKKSVKSIETQKANFLKKYNEKYLLDEFNKISI
uniref:Uncharacterized protein n=1 Tax=viral metagenome TaxID=1070528 RepID=A0A6C0D0C1_9ZZZZ